ncbi:hypothetical protein H8744_05945 [Oscillospiraceae bacterium N12]|jgi:predicted outer membrane repeat protein|uniref:Right handed beta helix domain-containing protein n=1 Tax=Jilunia laotingensis TaxID=2763675 RepID=A0A926IPS4_9BACT|nr:right-handed parallel beta-helix repeat-containing protein [Jilunia laotingensis]MBC8592800.1 hypothetical protein [Jilunia laotingensis]
MKKQILLSAMLSFAAFNMYATDFTVTTSSGDPAVEGSFPNIMSSESLSDGDVINFDFDGEQIEEFTKITVKKSVTINGLNKKNNKKVIFTGVNQTLMVQSAVEINDCVFTGKNTSSLYATTGATMLVDRCEFIDNDNYSIKDGEKKPSAGGAINVANSAKCIIKNSLFKDNKSAGGAIVITVGGDVTLENSSFIHNYASASGGAIYMYTTADKAIPSLSATNCTFVNNYASERGGAIYAWSRTGESFGMKLVNCTITSNYSGRNVGGGVAIFCNANMTAELTMANCIVAGNTGGSLDDNFFSPNDLGCWKGPRDKDKDGNLYVRNYTFNTTNCIYGVAESMDADDQAGTPMNDVFSGNSIKVDDFANSKIFTSLYKLDNTIFPDIEGDEVWSPTLTADGMPVALLCEGSIAIAKGTASYNGVTIPTTDQLGKARPATPAIGAVEYGGESGIVNNIAGASDIKIWNDGNVLYAAGIESMASIAVYDMTGKQVYEGTIREGVSVTVPVLEGLYIAKVNGATAKLIIK